VGVKTRSIFAAPYSSGCEVKIEGLKKGEKSCAMLNNRYTFASPKNEGFKALNFF
jgi:hypothetical protein